MTGIHVIQTVGSIAERTGGPARTIRSLCEALARQGARVTLLAGHDPVADDALLPPNPALVTTRLIVRRRRAGLPHYDYVGALAEIDCGRAILHDNGIWHPANLAATTAARRAGLPYVISPHGMLEPWAMAYRGGKKRLAWLAYQRRGFDGSAGVLATSRQELAGIRLKLRNKPVAVIANGAEFAETVPDRIHRDAPQPRTVLFMSRIHPVKNLPVLLDSWAEIAADRAFDDWSLRIAGPDELGYMAELVTKIERLNLGGRVTLGGPVAEADKAAAFAAADLYVLPSLSENFGIVVTEALAAGVPVIATTGTPWAELPRQQCGWWCDPDTRSLATAMRAAMKLPPAERRAMGVRGHAFVTRSFGWDRIAGETIAFYQWLLSGGSVPDFVDV